VRSDPPRRRRRPASAHAAGRCRAPGPRRGRRPPPRAAGANAAGLTRGRAASGGATGAPAGGCATSTASHPQGGWCCGLADGRGGAGSMAGRERPPAAVTGTGRAGSRPRSRRRRLKRSGVSLRRLHRRARRAGQSGRSRLPWSDRPTPARRGAGRGDRGGVPGVRPAAPAAARESRRGPAPPWTAAGLVPESLSTSRARSFRDRGGRSHAGAGFRSGGSCKARALPRHRLGPGAGAREPRLGIKLGGQ